MHGERFHLERPYSFGLQGLKSKKVRMLSSLANYLLGGNISGAQDSRERSNNESPESLPVIARLSQVEVEGEDWILIDRAGTFQTWMNRPFFLSPPWKRTGRNSKGRVVRVCVRTHGGTPFRERVASHARVTPALCPLSRNGGEGRRV